MKRTFTANIDGRVFDIDEDAYTLLLNYLDQLHQTFGNEEGTEIVADMESRIREHFNDQLTNGKQVIQIADVQRVISTMGRPEDLCGEGSETFAGADVPPFPPYGTMPQDFSDGPTGQIQDWAHGVTKKRLYRDMSNKVFGGVFGGLSQYLGWNANIMRLLYIVLACATYFWPLVLVYLFAWMIIPAAVSPRQVLEMKGEPVNACTIGQTMVEAEIPTLQGDNKNFFGTFASVVGKIIIGFVGLIAAVIGLGGLVVFIALITGIIGLLVYAPAAEVTTLFENIHFTTLGGWAIAMWSLVATFLCGALLWGVCSSLFKIKSASKSVKITFLIIFAMILIAAVVLSTLANVSF